MVEITNSGSANPDFPIGRIAAAQPCDLCKSAPALLFCRKDTVFLCLACDAKLHAQTKHERVWMCEVCEQAPACVTCKVDAAAMCVTCDRDVHLANPLARRHVRIPVVPFYSSAESVVNAAAGSLLDPVFGYGAKEENDNREMIRNMTNADSQLSDCCFNFGFGFKDSVNDAGVPVRSNALVTSTSPTLVLDRRSNEINFDKCVYNVYNKDSHSHTVSSSLMDSSGVVPDVNSLLDVSNPLKRPVNGGRMFCAKDREARVLRYREKRKKRKFEKKIRYASRKAYAEIRPRIKGRFVKRTELISSLDVDRWWLTTESNAGFGAGVDYGIVSSF